ncbi:hypothetical protein K8S19_05125 [bacterium]|nr:hypothetical protein [bacterium]
MKNTISNPNDYLNFKKTFSTAGKYFIALSLVVTLASCSAVPISRKAEVQSIKKIGIVSLSANTYIYNYKAGPASDKNLHELRKKAQEMKEYTGKTTDTTQASIEQILINSDTIYTNALKAISHWNILPIDQVKKMPAYQASSGEATDAKGFVPVTILPETKYFDSFRNSLYKEKNQKTFQDLTELCKQLDLDAVIVLRTVLAYEPKGLQLLGGLGNLLASKKTKAVPVAGTAISVVTKAGTSAVYRGVLLEYKGTAVPMLQGGLVNFTGDDAAAIKSYNEAIQASATALAETLNKELSE